MQKSSSPVKFSFLIYTIFSNSFFADPHRLAIFCTYYITGLRKASVNVHLVLEYRKANNRTRAVLEDATQLCLLSIMCHLVAKMQDIIEPGSQYCSVQNLCSIFLKIYNNHFKYTMWLFFYLKLHEYTRDIENLQYSNQIQRKKGKNGDNVDLTIKNVIFLKQHTNHLYIYIKENAYIHWILSALRGILRRKRKCQSFLVHQFSR